MDPSRHRGHHYSPGATPFPPPFGISEESISPPSPNSSSEFPILAIAILGIITTAFLLVSYYVFVIKCCLNWHRIDLLRRFSNSRAGRADDLLMVYTPAMENHGLNESIIRAIPTFKYRREGGEEGEQKKFLECVVCLNEFQEEETLRRLPNCAHAFHIDCIDIWLLSNANCPLCRSNISNTNPIPTNQIMVQATDQEFNQFTTNLTDGRRDDMVIELSGHGSDQTAVSQDMGSLVVEVSMQSTNTQHSPSPRKLEQRFMQKKQRKFQHVSSMGDECIDVREKDDQFSIQPIRRSFSMDSSADRQLYLSVQEIFQNNQNHLSELSTSEGCSRVRRSFFSFGHGRGSRNAVLPIHFEP